MPWSYKAWELVKLYWIISKCVKTVFITWAQVYNILASKVNSWLELFSLISYIVACDSLQFLENF